jgi:hypothetical protein
MLFAVPVHADDTVSVDEQITFSKHVAPIIFEHCTSCHRPGEAAPFPLMAYQDAKRRAGMIAEVTDSRLMPPWKAKRGFGTFANERSISDDAISIIKKWVEQGAPEGDPAETPALPTFVEGWQLGQPDVIVEMAEPFPVPAEGPDIYQNFVVSVQVPEGKYLKAIEFRPSARSVTHHSLFAMDTQGIGRQLDEAQSGPGFSRMGFRGAGLSVQSLGGWAVGGTPLPYPRGIAIPLPPQFDLILQSHFHPIGRAEEERSQVGLFLTDEPPARRAIPIQMPVFFGIIKGIDIPAGEKDYTISESFTLPVDAMATGISGHAHYICKEMRATATLPDRTEKPLIWIDDWDFSWQEEYRFREEIALPASTVINVSIHYDNSAENPQNPNNPPQRIRWGRESTDEMGSMTLMVTPRNQGDFAALDRARRTYVVRSLLAANPGGRRGQMRERVMAWFDADQNGRLDDTEIELVADRIGPLLDRGGFAGLGVQ